VGEFANPYNHNSPFICPSDFKPWAAAGYDSTYPSGKYNNVVIASSYAPNEFLFPWWAKDKSSGLYEWSNADYATAPGGQRMRAGRDPTKVFLLMDSWSGVSSLISILPQYLYNYRPGKYSGLTASMFNLHGLGLHIAFADGHVAWVPGSDSAKAYLSAELVDIGKASREW